MNTDCGPKLVVGVLVSDEEEVIDFVDHRNRNRFDYCHNGYSNNIDSSGIMTPIWSDGDDNDTHDNEEDGNHDNSDDELDNNENDDRDYGGQNLSLKPVFLPTDSNKSTIGPVALDVLRSDDLDAEEDSYGISVTNRTATYEANKKSIESSTYHSCSGASNEISNTIDGISMVEKTIRTMEMNNRCMHPDHWHSFRPVQTSMFTSILNKSSGYCCVFCKQKICSSPSVMTGIFSKFWKRNASDGDGERSANISGMGLQHHGQAIVQCAACGEFAHRTCSTSNYADTSGGVNETWLNNRCLVNSEFVSQHNNKSDKIEANTITISDISSQSSTQEIDPLFSQQKLFQQNSCEDITKNDSSPYPIPSPVNLYQQRQFHSDQESLANINQAIQENVIASFRQSSSSPDCYGMTSVSKLVDVSSMKDENEKDEEKSEPIENDYMNIMSNFNSSRGLNIAAVAGGIVGGLAGWTVAGPVGMHIGATMGTPFFLVEGTVALGVVAAGIATGSRAGTRIEEEIVRNSNVLLLPRRILTMGEHGTDRKLLLVRPNIEIDPVWENTIIVEAKQTAPPTNDRANIVTSCIRRRPSLVQNLLFFSSPRRGHDDSDITMTDEHELSTNDKVLLLVNRTLNDRYSLPGHVYRYCVEAYEDRCRTRQAILEASSSSPCSSKVNSKNERSCIEQEPIESVNTARASMMSQFSRARREDVHAIIKHVTATLLETRNEFASSPKITELTAMAVEGLVFGRLYDSVYDEIVQETYILDEQFVEKIISLVKYHTTNTARNSLSSSIAHSILPMSSTHEIRNNDKCFVPGLKYEPDEDLPGNGDVTNSAGIPSQSLQFDNQQNDGANDVETSSSKVLLPLFHQMEQPTTRTQPVSMISQLALNELCYLPDSHSPNDKLRICVRFLEHISNHCAMVSTSTKTSSLTTSSSILSADSLLKIVCQHLIYHVLLKQQKHEEKQQRHHSISGSKHYHQDLNGQIAFLEEFARDEQLLRGREGYALVTLQASLHFLNNSSIEDIVHEIFSSDEYNDMTTTDEITVSRTQQQQQNIEEIVTMLENMVDMKSDITSTSNEHYREDTENNLIFSN